MVEITIDAEAILEQAQLRSPVARFGAGLRDKVSFDTRNPNLESLKSG